jgi:transposase
MRVMCFNRLHSMLHRYAIQPPKGSLDARKHRAWWSSIPFSTTERLRVDQDLELIDSIDAQLHKVDAALAELSMQEPWVEEMPYLLQVPGVGWLTALTLLAAIGDIVRFESAQKLVGYAGLGAGVHKSGTRHQTGRITKEGRRELRRVLVEAAHAATRTHPHWKAVFERLEMRIGTQKALVAIARKLLIAIWHIWHEHQLDVRADVDYIGIKILSWAWKLSEKQRKGLTPGQFLRAQFIRLGIGHERTHIVRGAVRRRVAAIEEVLALQPELADVLTAGSA